MGNVMSWTEARTKHWLDMVTLGQYQIYQGPIGDPRPVKNSTTGAIRRPWGYIVTDKYRPGLLFKGRTPKQACEAAGLVLGFIDGYKGDK